MGKWTRQSNQTWSTLCHPLEGILSDVEHGVRRQYKICRTTHRLIMAAPVELEVELSMAWLAATPVTVISKAEYQIKVQCAEPEEEMEEVEELIHQSFADYVQDQVLFTRRLLHQFEFTPDSERTLKECLQNNRKLRVASDGSLDPELRLASFGWLLIGNGNILVRGTGPVNGIPDLLSSTRAELFGYGAL